MSRVSDDTRGIRGLTDRVDKLKKSWWLSCRPDWNWNNCSSLFVRINWAPSIKWHNYNVCVTSNLNQILHICGSNFLPLFQKSFMIGLILLRFFIWKNCWKIYDRGLVVVLLYYVSLILVWSGGWLTGLIETITNLAWAKLGNLKVVE